MGWFVTYLVSLPLAALVWCVIVLNRSTTSKDQNRDEIRIRRGDDVFMCIIAVGVWFITIPVYTIDTCIKVYKEHVTKTAKDIIHKYNFDGNSHHDRSFIVEVPEWALKYVFKAYRSKYIELKKHQAEVIREELMHRNAERALLK